ncbi:MAG: DNA/RNA nuclease SfsA [Ruminococcaceae bacterium]|nr:DNA/RNA nuclease SfsA [Oscillospiraceae bacterium]
MKYENTVKGKFISRPNRFIAIVEIDGIKEVCHVKNTGRCKELLIPGVTVILEKSSNEKRKTKYDVLTVYKGDSRRRAIRTRLKPLKIGFFFVVGFDIPCIIKTFRLEKSQF